MRKAWPTLLVLLAIAAVFLGIVILVRPAGEKPVGPDKDPFSTVALPRATGQGSSLGVAATRTVDETALGEAIRAFRTAFPRTKGTASFMVTITPDGSVGEVRFVEGSLGPGEGAALAREIGLRNLYAAAPGAAVVRTVLGPVLIE